VLLLVLQRFVSTRRALTRVKGLPWLLLMLVRIHLLCDMLLRPLE
jgi:hypothetical protein